MAEYPENCGSGEDMKVDGKVGIGTTDPEVRLQVGNYGSSAEAITVAVSGGGIGRLNFYGVNNTVGNYIKSTDYQTQGGDTLLQFGRRWDTDTDRVTFNLGNGKVGIGTTSPAGKLTIQDGPIFVQGNSWLKLTFSESDQSANNKVWDFAVDSGVFYGRAANDDSSSATNWLQVNRSGTTISNVVFPNGNVGIGRTPSTNKLEVEGDASKTTSGSWSANSDIRIKTDIEDIKNALGVIKKLHPVKFKYNKEYRKAHPSITDKAYYSFVAQEFQKVFPDSVKNSGENGYLQMDPYNVKPYLVAAVKELSEIIESQQNEINKLKEKFNSN